MAAVDEERKPILTPADLAAAIRAAADTDIDAAAALALFAPPDVPLPTHSLALLLRRLFTTRSIAAARGLLDKLHPSGEDGCPRPNPAPAWGAAGAHGRRVPPRRAARDLPSSPGPLSYHPRPPEIAITVDRGVEPARRDGESKARGVVHRA